MAPTKKPAAVPDIRSTTGFQNPSNLTREEILAISITTPEDIVEVLLESAHWNQGALGVICLNLSPDNQRVNNATLVLQGSLYTDKTVSVAALWPEAGDYSLSLTLDDLSYFDFPAESLTSDYLSSDAIEFEFVKAGINVPKDALSDADLSNFCLRAHVYPTFDTWAKLAITIYPIPESELIKLPLHQDSRFPGIAFDSPQFQLGPSPLLSPIKRSWGFPFVPCIFPGSTWDVAPTHPSGDSLRSALSSFLRSASAPDAKSSRSSFFKKVHAIQRNATAISIARIPGIRWPAHSSAQDISPQALAPAPLG